MDGHVFDQEWTGMDMNGEWTGMGKGGPAGPNWLEEMAPSPPPPPMSGSNGVPAVSSTRSLSVSTYTNRSSLILAENVSERERWRVAG